MIIRLARLPIPLFLAVSITLLTACSATELVPQPNNHTSNLETIIEPKTPQIVSEMPTITPIPAPTANAATPNNSKLPTAPDKSIHPTPPSVDQALSLVEAHEKVLTDIYDEIVPSVVELSLIHI